MELVDIDEITGLYYPEYLLLDDDERRDYWDNLNEHQKYNINREYVISNGISEYNYLMCNEPGRLDTDITIFDYPSMYEFDVVWWEFQRDAIWESIEDSKKAMEKGSEIQTPIRVAKAINDFNENYREYSIYCSGDWFRMIDEGVFLYSQVISAKWFIFYEIELYLDELQEKAIPYKLNDELEFMDLINEHNPSIKYKADGREYEVEALNKSMMKYLNTDVIEIIESTLKNDSLKGCTFRRDKGYDEENFDPFTDFIFMDEESLKAVNPKHFLNDFKSIQKPFSELERIIDSMKSVVKADFERIYEQNRSKFLSK